MELAPIQKQTAKLGRNAVSSFLERQAIQQANVIVGIINTVPTSRQCIIQDASFSNQRGM